MRSQEEARGPEPSRHRTGLWAAAGGRVPALSSTPPSLPALPCPPFPALSTQRAGGSSGAPPQSLPIRGGSGRRAWRKKKMLSGAGGLDGPRKAGCFPGSGVKPAPGPARTCPRSGEPYYFTEERGRWGECRRWRGGGSRGDSHAPVLLRSTEALPDPNEGFLVPNLPVPLPLPAGREPMAEVPDAQGQGQGGGRRHQGTSFDGRGVLLTVRSGPSGRAL